MSAPVGQSVKDTMNIPNALTIARVCLAPVLALLLLERDQAAAAAIVFAAAMATDALDGHLARSRSLITNFGKLMDPIADKLIVGAAFVCLAITDRVEPWIVAVILFREAAVTGLRMAAARREGTVIAANSLGKAKTAIQTVAILVLVVAADPYDAWVQAIVSATLAITVASGAVYALPFLPGRRDAIDEPVPSVTPRPS
jgi:CDP-diacylglycerol---glycerol-3-phosphate 3-phosphatidyltransferase